MFSKTANRPQAKTTQMAPVMPADIQRKAPLKAASLISADLSINGGLISEGEVHVDGKVLGDVKVSRLTLGESGVIEGSVTAESVEVRGKVIGPVTAKLVRLYASSHVDGDITHEQLAMETGAHFQGRSLKLQRQAPASSVVALASPTPVAAS
jgi:cytoskeletal protein CcmA (bactofilin family)